METTYSEFYKSWLTSTLSKDYLNKKLASEFACFTRDAYGTRYTTALSIGETIIARMSEDGLHYHTPPHVLNIFQFAKDNNIELENWEKTAIYFHDAVYLPLGTPGMSENCSAQFFQTLMKPFILKSDGQIDYNELLKISTAITVTSLHCDATVKPEWHKILDLDLFGFALPPEENEYFNSLVKKEYVEFGIKSEDYDIKRKEFLNKLISKGFLYRTELFRDKFETVAMENIKKAL